MEEGVSNLWTMRNDFHPRATAFTSRGSRGIQSFSIHSTSTPEDRLRGGERKKLGADAYESKSSRKSVVGVYIIIIMKDIVWITRVFPKIIVGGVLHALFFTECVRKADNFVFWKKDFFFYSSYGCHLFVVWKYYEI